MSSLVTPELKRSIKQSDKPGTHAWNGQGYLSSTEKDKMVIFDGMLNELKEYIAESVKLGRNRTILADIKRAYTLLDKSFGSIFESLDARPLYSLICMMEQHQVYVNRRGCKPTENEIAVSKADMEKCGFIMLTYCDSCSAETQREFANCDLHWFLTGTFGELNRGGTVCPFAENRDEKEIGGTK